MTPPEIVECASPVARFYEGQTIFMTGGTGFMGKVIVEKLLRSCPGIKKIYVLIRAKKGDDKNQRLNKIKNGPVFQVLRTQRPEQLNKLEALEGDIEQSELGLSEADKDVLKEVNIVFNVAATLNFNEDLRKSVIINVLATKTLLEMCLSIKNLKSFVHVSTAYSNCDRDYIEEKVYPAPIDLDDLVKQCQQCSDEDIEDLTARVLGKRVNTYILTKALAENVVHSYKDRFPIAIVRPSVVSPSLTSPYPGWVDCKTGATGVLSGAGHGLLRILLGDKNIAFDLFPVDLVDNFLIVVAWKTAALGVAEPVVYNAVSGATNKLILGDLLNWYLIHSRETPVDSTIWYPSAFIINNRLLYNLGAFFMHTVPAYVHDLFVTSSEKYRLVTVHQHVRKALNVVEYFTGNGFEFAHENGSRLLEEMSQHDRVTFDFDVRRIDWFNYMGVYAQGIRKYLLGQKDEDLPLAKKRLHMHSIKDKVLKVVAAVSAYYLAVTWATPHLVGVRQ